MKSALTYFVAAWLALFLLIGQATVEEGGRLASEPTLGESWVDVFLLLFVGICVFVGVAIFRTERKDKAGKQS